MKIQSITNSTNNFYNNKNIKKQSSNVSFHGVKTLFNKPVFNESKQLAEQALSLCKTLAGKQPTIDGIRIATTVEYGTDMTRLRTGYPSFAESTGFPLTLSKRFGNKNVSVIIKPNMPLGTLDYETVTLAIREGKKLPTVIEFNNSSDRMMSKKEYYDVCEGPNIWRFLPANEDDAKIFNSYVSKFLESSDKLIESFK